MCQINNKEILCMHIKKGNKDDIIYMHVNFKLIKIITVKPYI